jgi:beta-glucosidase
MFSWTRINSMRCAVLRDIYGEYPKAFVGATPYEAMGFKAGDEKIMKVPLDWLGFHYYTRRVVSNAIGGSQSSTGSHFGTETEGEGGSTSRDPLTQIHVEMPTEGPLTEAGLEIWPRGIYDLVMQITREYNHPIIEISDRYEFGATHFAFQKMAVSRRRRSSAVSEPWLLA